MEKKAIFVVTRFRLTREAIGSAIEDLRPDLDVIVLDPSELPQAITERAPSLIVCSQREIALSNPALNWLLIPSDSENLAVVSIGDEGLRLEEASLPRIIAVVDEAVRIAKMT